MRTSTTKKLTYAVILITSIVFLFSFGGFRSGVDWVNSVIMPIQKFFYEKNNKVDTEEFEDKTRLDLVDEIINLRQEKNKVEQEKAELVFKQKEFEEIAAAHEYVSRYEKREIKLANVIGLGANQDPGILVIDKGVSDGVGMGQAIITSSGVLAGKIFDVEQNRSYIRLLTHPDFAISISIGENTSAVGMVQGQFGLSAILSFVPNNLEVQKGQQIFTSNLDQLVPPGILIGQIEQVESEPNTQFLRGVVGIGFNPDILNVVGIVFEDMNL